MAALEAGSAAVETPEARKLLSDLAASLKPRAPEPKKPNATARALRDVASQLYKRGQYKEALMQYSKCLTGQEKGAKFPTSKAHISVVFHSFWLIFGRVIISRNDLERECLSLERARAERPR